MQRSRVGLSFLLAILCAGPCLAQSAGPARDPKRVYAATCHFCHDTGIGVPLKGSHYPADQIRFVVRHGYGAMIAFSPSEITDPELIALAQMLSEAAAPKATAAAHP